MSLHSAHTHARTSVLVRLNVLPKKKETVHRRSSDNDHDHNDDDVEDDNESNGNYNCGGSGEELKSKFGRDIGLQVAETLTWLASTNRFRHTHEDLEAW